MNLTKHEQKILDHFENLLPTSLQTIGDNQVNSVDARRLWQGLRSKRDFSNWIKAKVIDNAYYQLNQDYALLNNLWEQDLIHSHGGSNKKDYALTFDTAKKLAMMESTSNGNRVREYFLVCEKIAQSKIQKQVDWTDLDNIQKLLDITKEEKLKRINAEKKTKQLQIKTVRQRRKIKKDKPKVKYYDKVLDSKSNFTITQIAKQAEMTATHLNTVLEQENIQFKQSGQWLLKKEYQDKGLVNTRTHVIGRQNDKRTTHSTVWTEKGRLFILELLEDI